MKIADISVSRVHSYIRFEGRSLIIEDNGSKFGTMIKVNKPLKLLEMKYNKEPKPPLVNPWTGKIHSPINSSIYQLGRTMFYFRFENM